jgi:hypothetical protein
LPLRLVNAIALYERDPSTCTTEPHFTYSVPNKRIFMVFPGLKKEVAQGLLRRNSRHLVLLVLTGVRFFQVSCSLYGTVASFE